MVKNGVLGGGGLKAVLSRDDHDSYRPYFEDVCTLDNITPMMEATPCLKMYKKGVKNVLTCIKMYQTCIEIYIYICIYIYITNVKSTLSLYMYI